MLRTALLALLLLHAIPGLAIDSETNPVLAMRVTRALSNGAGIEASISARSMEGFNAHEREIAEVRYGRRIGSNEFSAAYNLQFDRNTSPGSEHRLWQQFRHQFALAGSSFESSVRLEERFFTASDLHGTRLRVLNRWSRALPYGHVLRLGYEWVFNLDDINAGTQRGIAQDRLIGAVQRNFANGNRLEFEYQLRYLHLAGTAHRIQNQLQLTYVIAL